MYNCTWYIDCSAVQCTSNTMSPPPPTLIWGWGWERVFSVSGSICHIRLGWRGKLTLYAQLCTHWLGYDQHRHGSIPVQCTFVFSTGPLTAHIVSSTDPLTVQICHINWPFNCNNLPGFFFNYQRTQPCGRNACPLPWWSLLQASKTNDVAVPLSH